MNNKLPVFTFGETAFRMGSRLMEEHIDNIEVVRFMHPTEKGIKDCIVCQSCPDLHEKLSENIQNPLKQAQEKKWWRRLLGKSNASKTIVMIAGLGGRFGGNALAYAAQLAHNCGYENIIAIVQKPFRFEGKIRLNKAETALSQINEYSTRQIVFDHAQLMHKHADMNLSDYFEMIDLQILGSIRQIAAQGH